MPTDLLHRQSPQFTYLHQSPATSPIDGKEDNTHTYHLNRYHLGGVLDRKDTNQGAGGCLAGLIAFVSMLLIIMTWPVSIWFVVRQVQVSYCVSQKKRNILRKLLRSY